LEIIYLDEVDSTQLYLIDKLKNNELLPPVAVVAKLQKNGIGSRNNRWIGERGNLFLSFAIKKSDLALDLPLQSLSIYFAYILKDILSKKGSKIWLKWPNDFFIDDKKIGGVITSIIQDQIVICGVGLNIESKVKNFSKLDIKVDLEELIKNFLFEVEKKLSWKKIFSKYKLEFQKGKNFTFHIDGKIFFLKDAKLLEDGSVEINNKKVYSLR